MATNNSTDPGLVSHRPSLCRKTSDLSRSLLSPDSFNSLPSSPDPIGPQEESSTRAQSKILAPIGPQEEPSTGAQSKTPAPIGPRAGEEPSTGAQSKIPAPIGPQEEPSTGAQSKIPASIGPREEPAQSKIPAPQDQFFRGTELGKVSLIMSGGVLGGLVSIASFYQGVLPKQVGLAPVIMLLMIGFLSLLVGLPFQETCPVFALVAVVGVGVPSVVAALLTFVAKILPPELHPFLWVIDSIMVAFFGYLLFSGITKIKGIRSVGARLTRINLS